jgi:hypothetical protein
VATFVALTMHGWWWPGRQLVVVLPLGVLAIAIAAQAQPWMRTVLATTAVLGFGTWAWTTVEAIARVHVLVVDFDHTTNPWVRAWRLLLPDGRAASSADEALLAAWCAALACVAWRGWLRGRSAPSPC